MDSFNDLISEGLYLGLIVLLGYMILCFTLKTGPRNALELLGFSFAAGAGVLPLLLFAISIAGLAPSRWVLIAITFITILIISALFRQRRLLRPVFVMPQVQVNAFAMLGGLAAAVIVAALLNVIIHSGWPVLDDVDSFAIWMFKAKWVAVQPLRPMPAVFSDPILSYTHQDYPLSFPFLVAGLYAALGRMDDTVLRILLIPTYLSLLAIVYTAIRRLHRTAIALAITAIFAAAPTLTLNAGLAVAETPLLLAYTALITLLLRWMETGEKGDLLLTGVFAAVAAFTKNEGLALFPILGLVSLIGALSVRHRQKLREWVLASTLSLVILIPWLIYRMFLPRTHEDYGSKLTRPAVVFHNLSRTGYVVPSYLTRLFYGSEVGAIWYVLVIAALLGWRAFHRGSTLLLWGLLLVQLSLYMSTFIVTPWDVHILLPMVTPKLLTQASPVAAMLIALHLRNIRWPGSSSEVIGRTQA